MLAGGLYERTSGAAGQPLAGYRRREPERTVLHDSSRGTHPRPHADGEARPVGFERHHRGCRRRDRSL